MLLAVPSDSFSDLELHTNDTVYTSLHPLQIYGTGLPNETLIIRLTGPDGTVVKFDQIDTNADGTFNHPLLIWPDPSTEVPYGTYTVELISTIQNGLSQTADIKFLSTPDLQSVPVERDLRVIVFAPETTAINQPFRVFIQVTSDGLLLGTNPDTLLEDTHVHLPSGVSFPLADSLDTLHQGLYFLDYVPVDEGTYVFHVVAFDQGTTAHTSVATIALSQDLGGISDQLLALNAVLDETSAELEVLKSAISRFDESLVDTTTRINDSTHAMSESVGFISEASSQINALLFPIIAFIGIIVALQIAIFARRR